MPVEVAALWQNVLMARGIVIDGGNYVINYDVFVIILLLISVIGGIAILSVLMVDRKTREQQLDDLQQQCDADFDRVEKTTNTIQSDIDAIKTAINIIRHIATTQQQERQQQLQIVENQIPTVPVPPSPPPPLQVPYAPYQCLILRSTDKSYIGRRPSDHPDITTAINTPGLEVVYADGTIEQGIQ